MRHISPRRSVSQVLSLAMVISLVAVGLTAAAYAGTPRSQNSGTSTFAYVGTTANSGTGYIDGFLVAADGSAQRISGSPWHGASVSVVASPTSLFATDTKNIVTYTIGSDGSLDQTSSVDGTAYDLDRSSSGVGGLSLAPDNRTLYADEMYYDGSNDVYLTWRASSSGQLSYQAPPALPPYSTAGQFPFTYSANGRFAYTWSFCNWDGSVWGFARRPDGSLNRLNVGAQPPPPRQGQGGSDCSQAVAASSTGYVAVAWNGGFCCGGAPVIATYAIQSNGTLALVAGSEQYIACDTTPMAFDPSGRYLAVGCNGIQVYGLSAQGRLTRIGTAQQRSVPFGEIAWDNANHVYGVPQNGWQDCQNGGSACGLYVFKSNAGVLSLAPGSPHVINQPASLAVVTAQ